MGMLVLLIRKRCPHCGSCANGKDVVHRRGWRYRLYECDSEGLFEFVAGWKKSVLSYKQSAKCARRAREKNRRVKRREKARR